MTIGLAQISTPVDTLVVLSTRHGSIYLRLFKETPRHRANMFKLVREGFYDSTTFHRVIPGFMIQGGDPNSKDQDPSNDGMGSNGYMVPAEFSNRLVHTAGAVAGARIPNPGKMSSGCQFYIVVGGPVTNKQLDDYLTNKQQQVIQEKPEEWNQYLQQEVAQSGDAFVLDQAKADQLKASNPDSLNRVYNRVISRFVQRHFTYTYTPEVRARYEQLGGVPHLDFDYTVFGETLMGLEVVKKIVSEPRSGSDRPLQEVRLSARLLPVTQPELDLILRQVQKAGPLK
jgi:cyclophilin family peptidyl-prolyl cis-trans isomerase